MNENLHNIDEPAISANEGWQQMHALLNAHLPVERKAIYKRLLQRSFYAALILTLLLFTGLNLDNYVLAPFHADKIAHAVPAIKIHSNSVMAININSNNKRFINLTRPTGNFISFKKSIEHLSLYHEQAISVNQTIANENVSPFEKIAVNDDGSTTGSFNKRLTGKTIQSQPALIPGNVILPPLQDKMKNKDLAKRSWNLFAGIGINTFMDNSQNLRPYPLTELRYNITQRLYLAAGLAAFSPVSTKTGGLSKTIYLNDTINNISLYNETTTYSNLHYADIPLSLGVNLTKNISIQSGIQLSVLTGKKTTKVLLPYDLQMNSVTAPNGGPLTAFAPNMENNYDVHVRDIDYRFIAGVRYTVKKTTIGLTYQHGLRAVGSGTNTGRNSNNLLGLSALFQIK